MNGVLFRCYEIVLSKFYQSFMQGLKVNGRADAEILPNKLKCGEFYALI